MGSQEEANVPKKRAPGSQIRWTDCMDRVMIEVLYEECMTGGKKSDNGWKPEALKHVVFEVNTRTKRVGREAINSDNVRYRLKTMKTLFNLAKAAITLSGFSYSEETHHVEADDVVWDSYLETNSDASVLRYKPVMFYKELCVICGNDTAMGSNATEGCDDPPTTPVDSKFTDTHFDVDFESFEATGCSQSMGEDRDTYEITTGPSRTNEVPTIVVLSPRNASTSRASGNEASQTSPMSASKKANTRGTRVTPSRAFENEVTTAFKLLADSARAIAEAFQPTDYTMLYAAIDLIPGLTQEEIQDAVDIFGANPEYPRMFWGQGKMGRINFVYRKLGKVMPYRYIFTSTKRYKKCRRPKLNLIQLQMHTYARHGKQLTLIEVYGV